MNPIRGRKEVTEYPKSRGQIWESSPVILPFGIEQT